MSKRLTPMERLQRRCSVESWQITTLGYLNLSSHTQAPLPPSFSLDCGALGPSINSLMQRSNSARSESLTA
ncbi:Uncharacterized protein HZ326_0277 [Fusarium oxysporum f. sp. albedinis]|nr:Uncharacterized protein HZ326_0277 [Fusarium oxysporum f. sp. albedinis]